MTNYDKLILEIWTNGTVTPEMALVEAAKILRVSRQAIYKALNRGHLVNGHKIEDTSK